MSYELGGCGSGCLRNDVSTSAQDFNGYQGTDVKHGPREIGLEFESEEVLRACRDEVIGIIGLYSSGSDLGVCHPNLPSFAQDFIL